MAYLHLHRRLQMSSWQRNILTIAALKVCPLPWSWLCDFPNFPLHNIVAYRTASGYKQFVRREMHSSAFIVFSVSAKFRSSWLESKSDSGFCWVIAREEITWNHLNRNRIGSDRIASHRIVLDWIGLDWIKCYEWSPKRTVHSAPKVDVQASMFDISFQPCFSTFWWYEFDFDMDFAVRSSHWTHGQCRASLCV